MNIIKSIYKSYLKSSNICKILIWIIFIFIILQLFKIYTYKEHFTQTQDFIFKSGDDVYDNFYADIYNSLTFSDLKDNYEIGEIVNKTTPTNESIILDIGSGTGNHVQELSNLGFNVIGIDKSQAMVNKAKQTYPNLNFIQGDILNTTNFLPNSFTHILCMYFTIYYFKNKQLFFDKCYNLLIPGGHLIIHLVDRDNFDPILPSANPLYLISPQRYAPKRITKSKLVFEGFNYEADFNLNNSNNIAKFVEKFKDKNSNKVRKQEHIMYMENYQDILKLAENTGFILQGKIDLLPVQYEYQYLYILQKPS